MRAIPVAAFTPANVRNPVQTAADVNDLPNVDTIAHPCMIIKGSRYYMFFTAKYLKTDEGGVGLGQSNNGREWHYRLAVIHEPVMVSTPVVFKCQNDFYMVPETFELTTARLDKATAFPDTWEYQKDLLRGDHFVAPTLVRYKDMWWMFTGVEGNETLRLLYAQDFTGPWTEHPLSPVVKKNRHTAWPAGIPFMLDGEVSRLGMDIVPTYGYQVHAFKIIGLSTKTYVEKMIDTVLVKASGQGWNADAMHHVDAHPIGRSQCIAAGDALGK